MLSVFLYKLSVCTDTAAWTLTELGSSSFSLCSWEAASVWVALFDDSSSLGSRQAAFLRCLASPGSDLEQVETLGTPPESSPFALAESLNLEDMRAACSLHPMILPRLWG